MAAKVLTLPQRHRIDYLSRNMNRDVILALRALYDEYGPRAFDKCAENLVLALCAVLAHEFGHDRMLDLFDLVEEVQGRIELASESETSDCKS
jgi:hypothetical protein